MKPDPVGQFGSMWYARVIWKRLRENVGLWNALWEKTHFGTPLELAARSDRLSAIKITSKDKLYREFLNI